ncbi:MAG: hypothetical protein E7610_05235 [Ruminococcaceae bacterium]|nr:hypothetical protein [Oscillospiraceae bacterium]
MGYNQANYTRIRKEYETKYLRAREAADLRRAEAVLAIPELAEIDRALGKTGLLVMDAAMQGEDLAARIAKVRLENEALQEKKRRLLVEHGYPADYTEIKYECPICQDEGFYEFKICTCMRKKLIEAAYESSGMANLLRRQSFDNFDLEYYADDSRTAAHMKRVLDIVRAYADHFSTAEPANMIFMGGTGLGKTHLSTSVARTVIDKGYDVFYAGAITLISDFEVQRYGNSVGGDTGLGTSQYFDCDLLIIDDLGTEVINQFTATVLYNVINTRLSRKKSTIINTNFSQDELRQKYSDRITSRLFGEYRVIPFVGKDVRMRKISRKP